MATTQVSSFGYLRLVVHIQPSRIVVYVGFFVGLFTLLIVNGSPSDGITACQKGAHARRAAFLHCAVISVAS